MKTALMADNGHKHAVVGIPGKGRQFGGCWPHSVRRIRRPEVDSWSLSSRADSGRCRRISAPRRYLATGKASMKAVVTRNGAANWPSRRKRLQHWPWLDRDDLGWFDRRKRPRRSSLQIVWWFFDSLGDYVVNLQGSKAKWQTLRRWRWRQSRSNIDNVLQLFYFM